MSWIGVDLDGTLAKYDGWKGIEHIGQPIPSVVAYVKKLRKAGIEVRIVTARCQNGLDAYGPIYHWSKEHLGEILPVTDRKDFGMVALIDDRAISVETNTGRFLVNPPDVNEIEWHDNPLNRDKPHDDLSRMR